MQIIEPSFEILAMPDGEEALSLLERIGRTAYKSEDKIDLGERGNSGTLAGFARTGRFVPGEWKREPSSHKFIKMILKAERKAKLVSLVAAGVIDQLESFGTRNSFIEGEDVWAPGIVDSIVEYMEQNPAHESVIEHCSATVLFLNNRGFTHEAVRHRLASFTQTSTRYCNYSKDRFGRQITITPDRTDEELCGLRDVWVGALETVEAAYMKLTEGGVKPQIARDVLPQNLLADIVFTANFREWRHVFRMRCSPAAHPDMRRLMLPLREEFRKRVPIIFD